MCRAHARGQRTKQSHLLGWCSSLAGETGRGTGRNGFAGSVEGLHCAETLPSALLFLAPLHKGGNRLRGSSACLGLRSEGAGEPGFEPQPSALEPHPFSSLPAASQDRVRATRGDNHGKSHLTWTWDSGNASRGSDVSVETLLWPGNGGGWGEVFQAEGPQVPRPGGERESGLFREQNGVVSPGSAHWGLRLCALFL